VENLFSLMYELKKESDLYAIKGDAYAGVC
jgi:hypothetical protein